MGNILNLCRNRKKQLIAEEDETSSKIEHDIYLPGSLNYLKQVGLDRHGKIIDKKSPLLKI